MKTIFPLFVYILLGFSSLAWADRNSWATQVFRSANQAYDKGNFAEAADLYEKILAGGIENADVYYNLGNSFFRQNQLGRAVLYYEKARKLAPADEDIQANLQFIKSQLADKIPEPETGFFGMILSKLHNLMPLRTMSVFCSVLLFVMCVLVIAGIFSGELGRALALYGGTVVLVIFLLASISLGFKIKEFEKDKYAVVMVSSIDALNEPEGNQTLFTVHEGAKFLIRKSMDNWVLVSLPNGLTGWVKESDLGKI